MDSVDNVILTGICQNIYVLRKKKEIGTCEDNKVVIFGTKSFVLLSINANVLKKSVQLFPIIQVNRNWNYFCIIEIWTFLFFNFKNNSNLKYIFLDAVFAVIPSTCLNLADTNWAALMAPAISWPTTIRDKLSPPRSSWAHTTRASGSSGSALTLRVTTRSASTNTSLNWKTAVPSTTHGRTRPTPWNTACQRTWSASTASCNGGTPLGTTGASAAMELKVSVAEIRKTSALVQIYPSGNSNASLKPPSKSRTQSQFASPTASWNWKVRSRLSGVYLPRIHSGWLMHVLKLINMAV